MSLPTIVLLVSFVGLLALNVPVAFCMGISTVLAFLAMGDLPAFVAVAHKIATGIDTPAGIEVMYHWALDSEDCLVTLRVTVDREAPALESIAVMCPAAEWIEREMWELLGIEFRGHPDMRHLLLDDAWPEGNYPLRRHHD